MKIPLNSICYNNRTNKLCHCCNAKIDFEADEALEEGFLRLRRSDAPTPLRKHLPKRLFELLRYQTTRLGASLFDVVRVGMRHHDAPVGAVLPDPAAYDTFRALLDPLLGERHWGFDADADEQPGAAWGDWRRVGAVDPERRFVQRLVVSASRNLDGFRFTPTMTPCELSDVENQVLLSLYRLPGEYRGTYDYVQCMHPMRKRALAREKCLFDRGDKYEIAANVSRFWSYGRGVYVNPDRSFMVWVNAKDHLRVISQEESGDLQKAYRRLANVMPYIDCRLHPARHERLGILTVDLDDVGSGLRIEADVQLPGIESEAYHVTLNYVAKVYHLEMKWLEDDLYRISGRSRLGYSEFEVVRDFNHGLRELLFMADFFEDALARERKEDSEENSEDKGSEEGQSEEGQSEEGHSEEGQSEEGLSEEGLSEEGQSEEVDSEEREDRKNNDGNENENKQRKRRGSKDRSGDKNARIKDPSRESMSSRSSEGEESDGGSVRSRSRGGSRGGSRGRSSWMPPDAVSFGTGSFFFG